MAQAKQKCDDCYKYLRDAWDIDCPKVCDLEAVKKKMKKVMLQNHPDKHPGEKEKYTPIFQQISDCNDRVIKDRCTEFGVPGAPAGWPGGGPEFFEPSDHFGWQAAIDFRYGAPGDEEFAKTLIDFLKKERPRMAKSLIVQSELGHLFQFFYTHGYGPAAVWARVAVDDPYNSTILKKADDAYLFILYITEQVDHVGPPISHLMKIRFGSKLIWPTSPSRPPPTRRSPRRASGGRRRKRPGPDSEPSQASRSRRRKGPTRRSPRRASRSRRRKGPTRRSPRRASRSRRRKGPTRRSPRRASRSRRRKGPTVAQKRADCRDRGLVYDAVTGKCRPSKKGGKRPRRASRARSRPRKGPTVSQKRADCRARGLVYDTVTGKCRPSKKDGKSPRRASRARRASPGRKGPTLAQKRKDCRDRGLVYDRDLNDCRPSKKGGRSPRRRSRRRSPRRRSRSPRRRRSTRRRSRSPRRKKASTRGCPAGYVRSPTGRCIKRGGAAYKKYFG